MSEGSQGEFLPKEEADIDLNRIIQGAVKEANSDPSNGPLSLRARLCLALLAIIVVANSVISIYNTIALREEIQCNYSLTNALYTVGDQSRTITKNVIDVVLSGKPLTREQIIQVREAYDAQYVINTTKRNELLKLTCNGNNNSVPRAVGSGS